MPPHGVKSSLAVLQAVVRDLRAWGKSVLQKSNLSETLKKVMKSPKYESGFLFLGLLLQGGGGARCLIRASYEREALNAK